MALRRALLPALLLAAAASTAVAATPPPFTPGEQIDLSIDYLHAHAGSAQLAIGQPVGPVWPVICKAKTEGLASLLDIREHVVTYWDAATHLPRGSDRNAIEVSDRHTDRMAFDRATGTAHVQVMRHGSVDARTRAVPAGVLDLTSALLAVRSAALSPGQHLELPVLNGHKSFTVRADVEGPERIQTPAGPFDTVRVRVQLGLDGHFRTDHPSYAWFTRDARHVPVRMQADFAVGSVVATLRGYRPGGVLSASR